MPTDKEIKKLIINVLSEEQYASATKNEGELYLTPIDSTQELPALPSDASTSTYVLKSVNGTLTWIKE